MKRPSLVDDQPLVHRIGPGLHAYGVDARGAARRRNPAGRLGVPLLHDKALGQGGSAGL